MATRGDPYMDKFMTKSLAALREPHVTEFLEQPNTCVVAWLSPSGGPRTTPVWYHYEQEAFWIISEVSAAKTRAIPDKPQVSLTIDQRTERIRALTVNGRAEVLDLDEEIETRMYTRYLGKEAVEAYRDYGRGRMDTMICIRIVPERAIWMDFAPMFEEMVAAQQ